MARTATKSPKKKRILIVEDEHPIAKTLQLKLEHSGYAALCAYNGAEALREMEQNAIDLILLDLVMPIMDGLSVLEELSAKKNAPPIIVLTNLGQADDADRCRQMGAKDYFIKAETPLADIVDKLARALS